MMWIVVVLNRKAWMQSDIFEARDSNLDVKRIAATTVLL
jgi:hypothetical protein